MVGDKVFAGISSRKPASKAEFKFWLSEFAVAKWRSRMAARMVLRKRDWKSTDVVLMGIPHAKDLSRILKKPVERNIIPPELKHPKVKLMPGILLASTLGIALQTKRGIRKIARKLKKFKP
ncbi:hypothetical protein HY991_00390 [Candidatus Micrarchaeota archaeon]|nr:hypothetical protein [Candidatus Micrarchaeota archaeon]